MKHIWMALAVFALTLAIGLMSVFYVRAVGEQTNRFLEQSQQQLERTQQELSALAEAAGDGQQQEKLKAQAELLCTACDLTEELFDREED